MDIKAADGIASNVDSVTLIRLLQEQFALTCLSQYLEIFMIMHVYIFQPSTVMTNLQRGNVQTTTPVFHSKLQCSR